MRSRELIPCEQLRPFVRLIWVLELDEPADFGPPERISPDGLLELVFHYSTPLACRYDGEGFERQPRSVAVSQTRRFLEIRPDGASGLVSVRFHPWGAYHFFGLPVSELADRQTRTEVLWGRAALELEEQLAGAFGDRERVGLVEQFLLTQLRRHHKADVEPLIRAIWNRKGRVAVSQLCRDLGIGERRLQRTFATALGTTPKRFARLARFLHACSLLRSGHLSTLTEVGLACGYYDQSHFIAEFKAFSGMTPQQFLETANLSFLELD
ncbi:MAG: helix-turn-helix domain-containing protein [Thermoanaerobaculia bacterium]